MIRFSAYRYLYKKVLFVIVSTDFIYLGKISDCDEDVC